MPPRTFAGVLEFRIWETFVFRFVDRFASFISITSLILLICWCVVPVCLWVPITGAFMMASCVCLCNGDDSPGAECPASTEKHKLEKRKIRGLAGRMCQNV